MHPVTRLRKLKGLLDLTPRPADRSCRRQNRRRRCPPAIFPRAHRNEIMKDPWHRNHRSREVVGDLAKLCHNSQAKWSGQTVRPNGQANGRKCMLATQRKTGARYTAVERAPRTQLPHHRNLRPWAIARAAAHARMRRGPHKETWWAAYPPRRVSTHLSVSELIPSVTEEPQARVA